MKSIPSIVIFIAIAIASQLGAAENVTDAIDLVRDTYRIDRHTLLVEEMRLNERESAEFWPIYRSYRTEMDKLGDSMVKLVLEYADAYPNVPEERAERLLKHYTELEEKIVSTRSKYLKRVSKEVSPAKALRWAQLENRMDLSLRLQLAGTVPVVPAAQPKP
jgi:hypothetical protein